MPAGTRGDGRCAPALLLLVQKETGGAPGSEVSFQSGFGGARENFQICEKCPVFSGFAGGRPATACAQQLGAAAGFGHGAGLGGLRHGGDAAAESVAHDFDAQQRAAAVDSRPGGARE